MNSWTVTLIIRADDPDDGDIDHLVCDELPAWLGETHGIETVLVALEDGEGVASDRVATSPVLLAINADPSYWDAKMRPYGACEVCGKTITAEEDRCLRADIDFVEHYDMHGNDHPIRRVRIDVLPCSPSGVSA